MASISGICSSSPTLKPQKPLLKATNSLRRDLVAFPTRPRLADRSLSVGPTQSVAREISAELSNTDDGIPTAEKKNKGLVKDPRALWTRYVDWLYQHKELGLFLDVSRIGFTDEFVAEMEPRFRAAFRAMEALEKGAIANPDEGRMVGHYWLRNSKLAPNSFLRLQIDKTLDSVCKFAEDVVSGKIKPPASSEGRFTQVLSVGIGGSALGPQFVAEALAPDNPPLKIRFIDNTDPAGIDHQIAQLGTELASTLVIVISKGVAITQENSLLDNTARLEGWLARFPMFDWVGGRTSVMSAVGLLPAALQGIDIREMLAGASLMDDANRTTVQLVMESLGKEFDLDGNRVNQGLSVYGNKGSTDQHAYIQQLREGVHNFFATFIEVLRDRPPGHDWELEPGVTCGDYLFGMLQGTRSALYANDRESVTVTVQEVTPRSVGALIALYERAVGIYASLVNINAYHQPGVEAGKKAAGEVLALQKRVLSVLNEASCKEPIEPLTLDEVAERCHAPEDIEMIYKIIAHMAANDRALIAEGTCGSPRSIKVFLGECNVDDSFA
ncbi:Glucose-6-phosphate isomerase 1, chloroplastic [Morella rubra]|uniref:Glucose-6-phosphate isomerase n=1 Tax=Morella rubra TaxID=262757 RepID=A0A6A1UTU1_9ROSI|nr:Glucose-6-phosphate isomerase 1, chloroplastic [Morella rubra]